MSYLLLSWHSPEKRIQQGTLADAKAKWAEMNQTEGLKKMMTDLKDCRDDSGKTLHQTLEGFVKKWCGVDQNQSL